MKKLKQVVGIDVAKDELVCTFGILFDDLRSELKSTMVFKNKDSGFSKLIKWTDKLTDKEVDLLFVMEATGVYHEKLSHFLHGISFKVAIVLPNKISSYSRTLEIKTVTDKTASEAITRFGLERKLITWSPPKPIFRQLKQLSRERDQIVSERTIIKNQIHAEKTEAFPNKNTLKRLNTRIKLLNKQEQEIKSELRKLVQEDNKISKDIAIMTSIPGVGELTATIVLAETNGFEMIHNKRQLTSYAGLDVKEKQSGTSVKGRPKISKRGNSHLRKAVHLPSLSAVKYCKIYRETYSRLVGKHGIKMKALVSIQRKLLELMYVLYKTQTVFDQEFEEKRKTLQTNNTEPLESSLS
jgi:transposase